MQSFLHYDIKVLLALLKSVQGNKKFFKFLVKNGYPELAAWSNVVWGDEAALHWLFDNNFPALAIMTIAIDGHAKAQKWINDTKDDFLIYFTAACKKDNEAMDWLKEHDLEIFCQLALAVQQATDLVIKDNMFPYRKHW